MCLPADLVRDDDKPHQQQQIQLRNVVRCTSADCDLRTIEPELLEYMGRGTAWLLITQR